MSVKKKLFVASLLFAFAFGLSAEGLKEFVAKAENIEKALKTREKTYSARKKEYTDLLIRITKIKASGEKGFFTGVKLALSLNAGNKLGYKVFLLEKEIKELKDDYFTYATLIIEEYNKDFMECLKAKCPGLKEKYSAREKWLSLIQDYSDLVKMEKMIEVYSESPGAQAEQDFSDYLSRKTIQAEERIYIFKEEKTIRIAAKKAGLDIKEKDIKAMDLKIKELEKADAEINRVKKRLKVKTQVDNRK